MEVLSILDLYRSVFAEFFGEGLARSRFLELQRKRLNRRSVPQAPPRRSILLNLMNDCIQAVLRQTWWGPLRLVECFIPSMLKTVIRKMNEDGKSYCHFYYLLLRDHVFLPPQTVGVSAVGHSFLERLHSTE